jgi:hypothetical protein
MNKLTILDINKINGIKYYLSIHSQQKKYLEKLFKEWYILKGLILNLLNNFFSFFECKVVKKDDIIIK